MGLVPSFRLSHEEAGSKGSDGVVEGIARRERGGSGRLSPVAQDLAAIDRYVGARIRERRIMLGVSQHEIARWLGVSYQQAHRYEKGTTRMSAGTLHRLAQLFQVEISYFFQEIQDEPAEEDRSWQRRFLELARAFERMQDHHQQVMILELSTYLARASSGSGTPASKEGRPGRERPNRSPRSIRTSQLEPAVGGLGVQAVATGGRAQIRSRARPVSGS